MGEEKPDEELMGKRKPSPRLSPASLDAGNSSMAGPWKNIRMPVPNFTKSSDDVDGLPEGGGIW